MLRISDSNLPASPVGMLLVETPHNSGPVDELERVCRSLGQFAGFNV